MKIAAAQTPVSRDPRENGAAIREQMKNAAKKGAKLALFSEYALSGGALKEAETDWDGVASQLAEIRTFARELRLWTVVGSSHRNEGRRPHNSLYVISDAGEIAARYDKRLCSNNEIRNYYSAGLEPVVFEASGFRFGMTICIEVCFPELFMEYERLDVDCVLFPAASGDSMFGIMAMGHAAANNCWIAVSTPVRPNGLLPSGVLGPDGFWMDQLADQETPGIVVVDLDRKDPRFDIPLNKARPWRRVAREGKIYEQRRVKTDGG
jgi:predicted amidohydrolase